MLHGALSRPVYSSFLITGASAIIAIFALPIFYNILSGTREIEHAASTFLQARHNRHLVNTFDWVKMMVEDTVRYQPHNVEAVDEFANMFPSGGHLVHTEHDGETQTQTVAMFHQLRCLDIIQREYTRLEQDGSKGLLMHHCLNYLRQSILCLADNRLEPVRSPYGPRVVSFSSDYVCKNWPTLYDAAERNYEEYIGTQSSPA